MPDAPGDERNTVPVLLFRAQQRLCALLLEHVVETMRPQPVEPVLGTPDAIKGLALIRGMPVPVVAMSALMAGSSGQCDRFVTVKAGKYPVALAVDSVLGVQRIDSASLRALPSLLKTSDSNAVSAIGAADAELLFVLDSTHLVSDDLLDSLNDEGAQQ